VHDQVHLGDAAVDRGDAVDGQDVAGGPARELVGAVLGAVGDGQGVDAGGADELGRLLRVGEELLAGASAPSAPDPSSR
jgi:hypothetical protein